jgi:hypothetical protein
MKKKIFISFAALAVAAVAAWNVYLASAQSNELSELMLANVEALATGETGGSSKWFSNLNWVECPLSKVNGAVAIIIRGITIPAYGQYTVYGNKQVCERELTLNSCNTADQTPCAETD